ncbi:hypothetical protein CASFOL_007877 [Castilleja foliolosa]|uniref:Uncharacterized protein n=1 Tax=Castilleja foliolosa TaxID=1961234 RepID=A0ABD3E252_9LAMI
MFLFIFVSNWSGALLPWKIIELPHGELAAPTNDINTTVALALLTSVAYFYAGLNKRGLNYFGNSNDSKHFFLHYFGNPRTQSYGYVKYRISNPSRKGRETDTQFKEISHWYNWM